MKYRGSWLSGNIDREYRRQKKWDKRIAEDKKRLENCFNKQEKK